MNNQQNSTVAAPLATIDGASLMAQDFPPLQFAVDRILPHGIFILAGSGKIGKSWLSLDICRAVATGGQVWDFHADKGEVLNLALADTRAPGSSSLIRWSASAMRTTTRICTPVTTAT